MVTPPRTFENFTPHHVDACAALAAFAPDPWNRADVAAELTLPARAGYVALAGKKVVAFAFFSLEEETAVLLQTVVEPASRGNGIATALLNHAFAALAGQGIANLVLEVRAGNTAARALYQKLGFAQIARRPGLYTHPVEDGFTLQKIL